MIYLQFWAYESCLGLAVSNINESQLQTYESKTLFLMIIASQDSPGLAEIKTYAQKMQDAQVTKSLQVTPQGPSFGCSKVHSHLENSFEYPYMYLESEPPAVSV